MGAPTFTPRFKDRAKTVPTLRCSAGAHTDSGSSSITITIPSTAQVGDLAVFVVGGGSSTCTPPSGVTKWDQSMPPAVTPNLHLFYRWLVAGDIGDLGLALTFTFGGSNGICGGMMAFANTSGFGINPTFNQNDQPDAINGHNPWAASVVPGPNDLYVGFATSIPTLTTGASAALLTTPPSGCTTQFNVSALGSSGSAGLCPAASGWTGPTHALRNETLTYGSAMYCTSVSFTLAPVGPHTVEEDQPPFERIGLPVYNYSNSSGSTVTYSSSDTTRGFNTNRPWPERVMGSCGAVNINNNMALGGAKSADICVFAYGTMTHNTVRTGTNDAGGGLTLAGTQTALTNRLNALYTCDLSGNDWLGSTGTTGLKNAANALFRLIRATTVNGIGAGGQTADGTWSTVSSAAYLGGSASKTTTPGGKITIPVTDKPTIDIVLTAQDGTAQSITGATYNIKVDGVSVATGTTHNEMTATGVYGNYKHCQKVVTVTGIAAGSHTVTVEHSGSSGDVLVYQGHMFPAVTPPWVVANLTWKLPSAGLTTWGVTDANRLIYNQAIRDVAATFTDGRVIVYDPDASGKWDTSVHVSAGDSTHQSEQGHALIAHEIIRLLNERITAPMLTHSTPTPLVSSSLPSTYTLLGKRRITLTSTWTGILEAVGGGGSGGGGGFGLQGSGGGAGAYAKKNSFTLTAGCVLDITVGSGGVDSAGANGVAGTVSKVVYISGPDFAANTVLVSADFGTGGAASAGAAGTGGLVANCVGDTKTAGGNGSGTTGGTAPSSLGGAGGTVANNGANYGGGGGGSNAGTTGVGGAGAQGVVKFT